MKGLMGVIAVLLLSALWASPQGRVTFKEGEKRIEVEIGGEQFATYHYGENWMKPFLHAVRARSGAIVTRGYPVERIAGESNDHVWHHGIWYGHGDINGVDFWREFTGDPKQDVKFPLPVGRFGEEDEVAAAAVYLASDQAGFVTGTTLDLNGGRLMR